jgi:hypothetical protein
MKMATAATAKTRITAINASTMISSLVLEFISPGLQSKEEQYRHTPNPEVDGGALPKRNSYCFSHIERKSNEGHCNSGLHYL